jgi:hypothetical protein
MKGQITELVTAVRKIAKLQTENAKLREVLWEYLGQNLTWTHPRDAKIAKDLEDRARALLEGK